MNAVEQDLTFEEAVDAIRSLEHRVVSIGAGDGDRRIVFGVHGPLRVFPESVLAAEVRAALAGGPGVVVSAGEPGPEAPWLFLSAAGWEAGGAAGWRLTSGASVLWLSIGGVVATITPVDGTNDEEGAG